MICKLCRKKEAVENGFCRECREKIDNTDWDEIAEKRLDQKR